MRTNTCVQTHTPILAQSPREMARARGAAARPTRWPRSGLWLAALALRWATVAGSPARQEFALEIPRVTVEELAANATLRGGLHSYVLTDHVKAQ